jgi:Mg-chelatase subunit ChlD
MFSIFIPPTEEQPNQVNPDYTHLAVILDRTGSMESIRDDTIGGFNAFLNEQKQQPGKATLTLVQFDSQDPYEVIHQVKTIQEVPELTRETYVPRATTPLLDAIGRGINDLEKCLADMKEGDRPVKVVFVVITDGQENASREFQRDQILKMINEKEKQSGWQFVFLSADLDAINDALNQGFQAAGAMAFDKTGPGARNAWASVSQNISDYRSSRSQGVSFSDEDRKKQKSEGKRTKK